MVFGISTSCQKTTNLFCSNFGIFEEKISIFNASYVKNHGEQITWFMIVSGNPGSWCFIILSKKLLICFSQILAFFGEKWSILNAFYLKDHEYFYNNFISKIAKFPYKFCQKNIASFCYGCFKKTCLTHRKSLTLRKSLTFEKVWHLQSLTLRKSLGLCHFLSRFFKKKFGT